MISFYVDIKSYDHCTDCSDQVMVYGWSHCLFSLVLKLLHDGRFCDKRGRSLDLKDRDFKVFDYNIGFPKSSKYRNDLSTLEGRVIEQIVRFTKSRLMSTPRICKAGITNLVYENLKRHSFGLPLIPLLFVINIKGNEFPSTAKTILSRDPELNQLVTNAEIRRCYRILRLAEDLENKDLQTVCEETFRFVKVVLKGRRVVLKRNDAPWKSRAWKKRWKKRMATKPKKRRRKPDDMRWQRQFIHFTPAAPAEI